MNRTAPLRILLLAQTPARREELRALLAGTPGAELAGLVGSAEEAVAIVGDAGCDVILVGTRQSALEATALVRQIMQVKPAPIVVLAEGSGGQGEARPDELVEAGALAVLHQPRAAGRDTFRAELLQTLQLMSEVKVVRRWRKAPATEASAAAPPPPAGRLRRLVARKVDIVAIGASTGGPVALKTILGALPSTFPVPVLVVQHMATGFMDGLAQWLSTHGAIRAVVASHGMQLCPGLAYLAPDGVHMRAGRDGRLAFDEGEPVNGHRPAVSKLFESVAVHYGPRSIAILLTGMGSDGADELKTVQAAGGITIAQDVGSSVVHGMPGTAIRAGAATYVMSPDEIALALPALVKRDEGLP